VKFDCNRAGLGPPLASAGRLRRGRREALEWTGAACVTRLEVTSPCIRCVVLNVDPATAEVAPATLMALEDLSQRRKPGGPTAFGVYARGQAAARLQAGDLAQLELAF
jgi:hypothetical protein